MIDLSYFQNNNSNVQGFFNGGTWSTWVKPRGAKIVNFFVVGSGAGGGGGYQAGTGTIGGGSGGGGGATSRLSIDAKLLPDILYILPGAGGTGGLGGSSPTSGANGQSSFVCLVPDTSSISNIILRSGTIPSIGGNPGSNTAGGALVLGETLGVITNNIFVNLGYGLVFIVGASGAAGGTGVANGFTPSSYITIATGGGGTGVGGLMNATGVFPAIQAAPINTNGVGSIILYKPTLMLLGGFGAGGGTNGGRGGNGAPGAGGGGGGAGTVSAGNGGNGGNGFIIITTNF